MRKVILSVLGVLLIIGAFFLGKYIIDKNTKSKPQLKKSVKSVFTKSANTTSIPVQLTANGSLVAKNRIELYAEVQGVLKTGNKSFKEGTKYKKGETLLSINADEFKATLLSQKSSLFNLITAIQPDLRLDYPNEFEKWNNYLQLFDINKPTPKLPEFSSDKEKYFISGRSIVTAYYNVKNLEVKLSKYNIRAPFSGILTNASVTEGTLVRVGQKLGEFISTGTYEMEVAVEAAYADLLQVGNTVQLSNLEKTKTYSGKVVRVNGNVDQTTQTVKAFIEISDNSLKEGLFLEANLEAKRIENAIEIDRKLLVDDTAIYIVKNDSILTLQNIIPVYFGAEKAIIKGIENGTELITQPVSGAFNGMIVKVTTKK